MIQVYPNEFRLQLLFVIILSGRTTSHSHPGNRSRKLCSMSSASDSKGAQVRKEPLYSSATL